MNPAQPKRHGSRRKLKPQPHCQNHKPNRRRRQRILQKTFRIVFPPKPTPHKERRRQERRYWQRKSTQQQRNRRNFTIGKRQPPKSLALSLIFLYVFTHRRILTNATIIITIPTSGPTKNKIIPNVTRGVVGPCKSN